MRVAAMLPGRCGGERPRLLDENGLTRLSHTLASARCQNTATRFHALLSLCDGIEGLPGAFARALDLPLEVKAVGVLMRNMHDHAAFRVWLVEVLACAT